MKKNKSRNLALLATGMLWAGLTQAQESVNASGGDASGTGGTVAYSVGQVVYTTNSDASGTVSQGVQQAFEIYSVGIKETELNISLSVFPNPTTNNLTLQVKDYNNEKLVYQLYDMQGKLIKAETITSYQTLVDMSNLPSAAYFINISQENKQVQSFKIIKQ